MPDQPKDGRCEMVTDRWTCGTGGVLYHALVHTGTGRNDCVRLWLCLDCVQVYASSDEYARLAVTHNA